MTRVKPGHCRRSMRKRPLCEIGRPESESGPVLRWGRIAVGVRARSRDSPGLATLQAVAAENRRGPRCRGKPGRTAIARRSQGSEGWAQLAPTNLRRSNSARSTGDGPVLRGSLDAGSDPSKEHRDARKPIRPRARSSTANHDRKPLRPSRATRARAPPAQRKRQR
jgi:hypothetical protein